MTLVRIVQFFGNFKIALLSVTKGGFFIFMSYPNQEGPINQIRPAEFYKTCIGCKYLQHNLWKSGPNPVYTDKCTHESAPNPKKHFLSFNDLDNQNGYPEPGEWCPFEPVNKIDLP